MNNFFLKIKNTLKSLNGFTKINPHKHWVVLLSVFSVLVGLLILFSFYLLYQIKSDQIFKVKVEVEEKKSLLKEDLLKKTKDLYDKKAERESEIISNPSPYKDPSF